MSRAHSSSRPGFGRALAASALLLATAVPATAQFGKGGISLPKPSLPSLPAPKPPSLPAPKPPKIDVPVIKPPAINVPAPKPPKIDVPVVKPPKINVPPVKIPPLIVLKPPQGSTLPVEPDRPGKPNGGKPNGNNSNGQTLGNSVPGIPVPPKPKPPSVPPKPPVPPSKPNNTIAIVIPPLRPLPPAPQPIVPQPFIPQPVAPQPIVPQSVVPQPAPQPQPEPKPAPLPKPDAEANALRVTERVLDAPAALSGIELGDVLISVGGQRVRSVAELDAALGAAKGKVAVVYYSATGQKVETRELAADGGSIGVKVEPVTVDLQEEDTAAKPAPEPEPTGETAVQVTSVTARSAAARAGIQVGDVIFAVGGKRVSTPAQLAAALKEAGAEVEVQYVNPDDGKAETLKLKVADGGIGVSGRTVSVAEK